MNQAQLLPSLPSYLNSLEPKDTGNTVGGDCEYLEQADVFCDNKLYPVHLPLAERSTASLSNNKTKIARQGLGLIVASSLSP